MKISLRILLINFVIVALIIGATAVAFYSIMYNLLAQQQSQHLLTSANNFIYVYQDELQTLDDDFLKVYNSGLLETAGRNLKLNEKDIDFIFRANDNTSRILAKKYFKDFVNLPSRLSSIKEFLDYNPYAVVKTFKAPNGSIYYYGRIISSEFLNSVSNKINSEIALIWNNTPIEISNQTLNNKYFAILNKAYSGLSGKGNFDIYGEGNDSDDLLATIYRPAQNHIESSKLEFLIFSSLSEASSLRDSLKTVLGIIGVSGVLLALILTLVFTDKLRKQITDLSKATELTKTGNFKNKIKIKSRDEIGKLGEAFNTMLDELDKYHRARSDYSEFMTLINQNPTLSEISEAALKKIIKTCGFSIGALYTIEDGEIKLESSYGAGDPGQISHKSYELFKPAIENKETVEISSRENLPVIKTGLLSLEIKHLLIVPVIYNNKVIALLELGSIDELTAEAREYLSKIQEQLAIGLTNAMAIVQLENLVKELKKLNEDYQKQNVQIRKQNEALVELHNQLKQKAEELEAQKKKAEESTQVKSQFLASMSHELRTPMNSILGLTELIIEKAELDDKNKERLNVVLKSSKRLMVLINDILDLSKIEAGKMELRHEDVLLEEIIEEVELSVKPLADEKKIDFRVVKYANTRIIINTDRGKVTQVLINLLGNAVKFTENGYVELQISDEGNKTLKFDIIDTGIGISEEDRKIIFEEFRQIDGTTTRKYSGTGLGLAISKKIVNLLGGNISVESTPGKGSKFSFTIPFKFVDMKGKSGTRLNIKTLIKNRQNPILIIDDDAEVRYTIGQYLISKGYSVEYAENGDQGIEKAINLQPFAITLDVMLPKKDGWSILKDLKENPNTTDIPVIMISILADRNIGYGLGAFEYFVKPISSEQLLSVFNKLESLAKKRIQKIVIVDDDELEFEKFKREFGDEDIRIEYIQDSEFAFNKIAEVQPDLIIIDLMMPKVDGITLSYKLKSNINTKHIPIIISTAKDLTDDEKHSLNNIVEEITVKSKGHPMDVLKIVRDRIKLKEMYSELEKISTRNPDDNSSDSIDTAKKNINSREEYKGEVLIVDDDSDTLFTINEIVESCKCKTVMAKSGAECLKILETRKPDLILLDIMMPGIDGFQTLSKIKENSKWAQIPVFAVTAKAMVGDKEVILRYGFDDYIAKPVNPAVMSFKIEQLFSKIKTD